MIGPIFRLAQRTRPLEVGRGSSTSVFAFAAPTEPMVLRI